MKTLDLRYNEMCNSWDVGAEKSHESEYGGNGRMVLSWKMLNVSVKKSVYKYFEPSEVTYKHILYNVSGSVKCGNLLGIMGPSGSGKTTLMATISQRTRGNFEGELFLNGRSISEEMMIKISGFVPQYDITLDQLTVFEHLSLMAKFKMDRHTTKKTLNDHIHFIVCTIGMQTILDTKLSFLSGGERKKVALAVQLLNDLPILFCDEITTGLDSYSAAHIINILKSIARTGKIVICTIHQPASGVFDKFDDVILLSNGRLVYHGSVLMIDQFFQKFNYCCPNLYNKADFVISILNSNDKQTKNNVDEMCQLSSMSTQTNLDYDLLIDQIQYDYSQHLQIQKPLWITQLILILTRSFVCTLRSYKIMFMQLGAIVCLGIILSTSYSTLKLDMGAVQNWQGFLFSLTTISIFQYSYTSLITFHTNFSVFHREISNNVYALSAYYISQIITTLIWTILESLIYIYLVFWIIGINCEIWVVTTFVLIMLISRAYGNVLSACFEKLDHIFLFSLVYEYVGISLSGAYLSLRSLPIVLYYLKYFSIFFLGCETLSILHWKNITFLPCLNKNNCLPNGKEVLLYYGYDIDQFNTDIIISGVFYIAFYIIGYYGLLKRIKRRPAY